MSVYMKKRHAGSCIFRRSYGFSGKTAWVRSGCKADFIICYTVPKPPACRGGKQITKRLFSHYNRHYSYNIHNARHVRSMFVKRKYSGNCILRRTYGYSGRTVWVRSGCKADFIICYQPKPRQPPACGGRNKRVQMRLFSHGNRHYNYTVKNAARVHSIWMKKRFAGACNYGRQFGIRGTQVWVRSGCKADFIICYQPKTSVCRRKTWRRLYSIHNRHNNYNIRIRVKKMMVKRRYYGSCVYGRTFGFRGTTVWVRGNCRADFWICY